MATKTPLNSAQIVSWLVVLGLLGAACGSDSSFLGNEGPSKESVVPEGATWSMIWADEFEGAAGSAPSATWIAEVGTDWGNQQLEFDTGRPENVSLDGEGHLLLTARKESYEGREYTSARLKTQGTFERKYGKFSIRMKLPKGQGLWPAFWLLGSSVTSVGWPECGEVDVLEYRGQNRNELRSSLHGPGYSAGDNMGLDLPVADDLSADFHVYTFEWTEQGVAFSLDGERYLSFFKEDFGSLPWVFDAPFFMILNLAVGGTYVGDVGEDTVFPAELVVDWVRVYELKES